MGIILAELFRCAPVYEGTILEPLKGWICGFHRYARGFGALGLRACDCYTNSTIFFISVVILIISIIIITTVIIFILF